MRLDKNTRLLKHRCLWNRQSIWWEHHTSQEIWKIMSGISSPIVPAFNLRAKCVSNMKNIYIWDQEDGEMPLVLSYVILLMSAAVWVYRWLSAFWTGCTECGSGSLWGNTRPEVGCSSPRKECIYVKPPCCATVAMPQCQLTDGGYVALPQMFPLACLPFQPIGRCACVHGRSEPHRRKSALSSSRTRTLSWISSLLFRLLLSHDCHIARFIVPQ